MIKMCCFVILTDKNFANNYFNVFKTISFRTLSLIGEPRDIPNIYLIRIFSAISLKDNWH